MFNMKVVDMNVINLTQFESPKWNILTKSYDFSCVTADIYPLGQPNRVILK